MQNKAYSLVGNWDQMRLGWGLRMRLWAQARYAELHEICDPGDEMKVCSCWRRLRLMLLCCYGMVDCTGCCHDLPLPQWKLQPTPATFQYPPQFNIAISSAKSLKRKSLVQCCLLNYSFSLFFPRHFFIMNVTMAESKLEFNVIFSKVKASKAV